RCTNAIAGLMPAPSATVHVHFVDGTDECIHCQRPFDTVKRGRERKRADTPPQKPTSSAFKSPGSGKGAGSVSPSPAPSLPSLEPVPSSGQGYPGAAFSMPGMGRKYFGDNNG